ncbi:MAG: asparagine--tRNA ligase [Candidatus Tyloplasma litorale]|nr:MAG: asparagine--tRNA ligase [Mycoplasmatales bacterium]
MEIKNIYINKDKLLNNILEVNGWVRFNRSSKKIGFIELTDGTKLNGIQLVYKKDNEDVFEKLSSIPIFSAIEIKGKLIIGKNENLEILVREIISIRKTSENFPIGKKEHGLEFLRQNSHLRIKTKLFQSIMKIRSTASLAIHNFFNDNNFIYIHTPIITSNDAEGAGESFEINAPKDKGFFDKKASLTVSGQMHAEGYAQALKNVYTFGPTFRAENSHTKRHASEFWMVEPESAFCDYHEMMDIGWKMLSFIVKEVLKVNNEELKFIEKANKNNKLIHQLENISKSEVKKISYKEAINILQIASKKINFQDKDIKFGMDLGTEHEKYLAGVYFNSPVYVYDYPKEIKSFYMYQNEDGTVRGFDLLIPEIGELIGGSQREDRYEILIKIIKEKNQDLSDLHWYTSLRENGYAKSTGFGLGFERMIMFLTGMDNIRDVIPYPRTPGKLNF